MDDLLGKVMEYLPVVLFDVVLFAFAILIAAAILYLPRKIISRTLLAAKLRKDDNDELEFQKAVERTVGKDVQDYLAVAGMRVKVKKSRDSDIFFHHSLALIAYADRLEVFILWKRHGEMHLKFLQAQTLRQTRYVAFGNVIQFTFLNPDVSGKLVVNVEPELFCSETDTEFDAMGISQKEKCGELKLRLKNKARRGFWFHLG